MVVEGCGYASGCGLLCAILVAMEDCVYESGCSRWVDGINTGQGGARMQEAAGQGVSGRLGGGYMVDGG